MVVHMVLLMINYSHLILNQQYLVDIGPFVIASFCLECLSRRRLFVRFMHMLLLLALSCPLGLAHGGLSRLRCRLVGLVSLCLGPGSCNLFFLIIVFGCCPLALSINLNSWSLNLSVIWSYALFSKHQPSLKKCLCSSLKGNLNFLQLG